MRTERERIVELLRAGTDMANMSDIMRAMGWQDSQIRSLYEELDPLTQIENIHGKFYLRFTGE